MPQQNKFDISICIATFKRPKELNRLLEHLLPALEKCAVDKEVILIDNDAAQAAMPVFESWRSRIKNLTYYVEPVQSIALARNLAVQKARGTWVAFIDDDERPHENWLMVYWQEKDRWPAEAFLGPVLPVFENVKDTWLDRDLFFNRKRHETGTVLEPTQLRSGNIFLKRVLLQTHEFKQEYGLSGGEDFECFYRMHRSGTVFISCDNAIVHEHVPPDRVRLRWLLKRAFAGGQTYTKIRSEVFPGFLQSTKTLVKALAGIVVFGALLPFSMLAGFNVAARILIKATVQLGHIAGVSGSAYNFYRETAK